MLTQRMLTFESHNQGKTVLPKLLHLCVLFLLSSSLVAGSNVSSNCLHGSPIYMDWPGWSDPSNGLTQRWGPAMSYHRGFKWIWLNKGRRFNPDHTLEIFNVSNVVFADELALKQHLESSSN